VCSSDLTPPTPEQLIQEQHHVSREKAFRFGVADHADERGQVDHTTNRNE